MRPNIFFPASGCQKLIEVGNERKLCTFYEKRMATKAAADALGEEWKVYGGNGKLDFPIQQSVLTHGRVHLLLKVDVRQCAGRKPLNKGKKPRTKAPKLWRLVTPRVLQNKRIALNKQRTKKNKEEAAESAELLSKKMMEAKENHQEQISKRHRLFSLRASTSKTESN
ncbi:40S ribosomal protein S6 [Pteropus alecto]|uniref:Small ribosomal subunit protein eS6 n=1 Tax=Pteropus alecto TaxID=9402 RepID=L5KH32_PTEAL|nr:40S ribosomal protein S6 [Pteropus alecto]